MAENCEDFACFVDEGLNEYLTEMSTDGKWGGHLEMYALCNAIQVQINVFLVGHANPVQICSNFQRVLRLSFSGNHYSSVRAVDSEKVDLVQVAIDVCQRGDPAIMQLAMDSILIANT